MPIILVKIWLIISINFSQKTIWFQRKCDLDIPSTIIKKGYKKINVDSPKMKKKIFILTIKIVSLYPGLAT